MDNIELCKQLIQTAEAFKKKMEEEKQTFEVRVNAKLDVLSSEEKTALADLLEKLNGEI